MARMSLRPANSQTGASDILALTPVRHVDDVLVRASAERGWEEAAGEEAHHLGAALPWCRLVASQGICASASESARGGEGGGEKGQGEGRGGMAVLQLLPGPIPPLSDVMISNASSQRPAERSAAVKLPLMKQRQRSPSDERGGRPLLYSHAGVHGPEHVREDRVPELRLVRGGYSLPRRRVNVRRMHALVRQVDPEPVCKRSAVRTASAQAERCCTHGCAGLSRVWLRTISTERVV